MPVIDVDGVMKERAVTPPVMSAFLYSQTNQGLVQIVENICGVQVYCFFFKKE
ncbi:MAG: hypothetical protein OQK51_03375 [Kangiellaceae bacterium]|nr:hypothetical protein [Kangiellaceae bacterium]